MRTLRATTCGKAGHDDFTIKEVDDEGTVSIYWHGVCYDTREEAERVASNLMGAGYKMTPEEYRAKYPPLFTFKGYDVYQDADGLWGMNKEGAGRPHCAYATLWAMLKQKNI